ncbi:hypothetical protein [Shinella zoogloeoides]|uniref:hypothetical protein n=1 Tax=Shinella zoogloeoides TaxID=352475 RepID=UPI00299E0C15|nr:hypothetical protein [Shinella zoogloeoides]
MTSRQVERAQMRRAFKEMDRRAKERARAARRADVEKRETPPSTLRLAAMRAVSRLQPKRIEKAKASKPRF